MNDENEELGNQGLIRSVLYTDEFKEFYDDLGAKAQNKIDYIIELLKDFKLIHTDFIKKLVNTKLYEIRISVGTNEYRSILFSMDHENIIEATQVVILNGFLKKSTKDYNKQIRRAVNILNDLES